MVCCPPYAFQDENGECVCCCMKLERWWSQPTTITFNPTRHRRESPQYDSTLPIGDDAQQYYLHQWWNAFTTLPWIRCNSQQWRHCYNTRPTLHTSLCVLNWYLDTAKSEGLRAIQHMEIPIHLYKTLPFNNAPSRDGKQEHVSLFPSRPGLWMAMVLYEGRNRWPAM